MVFLVHLTLHRRKIILSVYFNVYRVLTFKQKQGKHQVWTGSAIVFFFFWLKNAESHYRRRINDRLIRDRKTDKKKKRSWWTGGIMLGYRNPNRLGKQPETN